MASIIEKAEDYVSSAAISRELLRDKLSECLTVERGGLKLLVLKFANLKPVAG